jgi:hypothetical protein
MNFNRAIIFIFFLNIFQLTSKDYTAKSKIEINDDTLFIYVEITNNTKEIIYVLVNEWYFDGNKDEFDQMLFFNDKINACVSVTYRPNFLKDYNVYEGRDENSDLYKLPNLVPIPGKQKVNLVLKKLNFYNFLNKDLKYRFSVSFPFITATEFSKLRYFLWYDVKLQNLVLTPPYIFTISEKDDDENPIDFKINAMFNILFSKFIKAKTVFKY